MKAIIAFIVFLSFPLYSSLAQGINSIATVYGSSYGLFITDNPQKADIFLQYVNIELLPESCRARIKCSYHISSNNIPAKIEMGISFIPDKNIYTTGNAIKIKNKMLLDSCSVLIDGRMLSDRDISLSKDYLMYCNEIESLQVIKDSLFHTSRDKSISYNPNYDTRKYSNAIDSIDLKLSDMIDSMPYVNWECILDNPEAKIVDVQWTIPFGIEISSEYGDCNLFFLSFNLPDNSHWNGVSDSTSFAIHWDNFSDMVIDKATPGNYIMQDKYIRWNVGELDLKQSKRIKILFHSSDNMPARILRSHEFTGFSIEPVPIVLQKLSLP